MLSLIVDAVKTVFGWMGDKSKAKYARDMAALELEKRLLLSKHEANSQWEIAQLKDKDKSLRWTAFLLFASPLIVGIINPAWGHRIEGVWSSLSALQHDVLTAMCLAVFGMRSSITAIGGIVGSVKQALGSKDANKNNH